MQQFTIKTFQIPALKGISTKTIEEHLKLYTGYVKNANLVLEKIAELKKDSDPASPAGPGNVYLIGELNRRFSFEYNGIRNHEIYFSSFAHSTGSHSSPSDARPSESRTGQEKLPTLSDKSTLKEMITDTWGSFEAWLTEFKTLALTRGIGWAMLYFDHKDNRLLNSWVDEQHLGQLQGCTPILALDMWEHSFVADYQPSGKKNYVEDFFANLNWGVVEGNFTGV